MSTDAAAPQKRRYSEKLWKEIETRACAGVGLQALSEASGITVATINDRSKRHKWETPARLARRRKAALSGNKTEAVEKIELRASPEQGNLPAPIAALVAKLADASPAEFSAGVAEVAQIKIAQGIQDIPPPRNIAELKVWHDIHRKAAGLDARDTGKRGFVLVVNPPRSLSRRPVVDV